MQIDRIVLENFRSYTRAEAAFSPGINVICGENAQGKTNLLEAVYLTATGRSFRSRFDKELISFGQEQAQLCSWFQAGERTRKIEMVLSRGRRRTILHNGGRITAGALAGELGAVLFRPEDLNLIRAGAAERRRFMDLGIAQLRGGYGQLIGNYTRLLEHKSGILRSWRERPDLLDALDTFNEKLAVCGAQIIRYRAAYARRLNEAAGPIHRSFSGEREELCIRYKTVSTVADPTATAAEIFSALMVHQRSHRQAELDSGSCLTGPHRDDLEVEIGGVSARAFASQGQTRTAALSIKLAERDIFLADTGEPPILLLDDVLSELDAGRQDFVLNRIGGGQTLITCCEDGVSAKTGGRVLSVRAGQIGE